MGKFWKLSICVLCPCLSRGSTNFRTMTAVLFTLAGKRTPVSCSCHCKQECSINNLSLHLYLKLWRLRGKYCSNDRQPFHNSRDTSTDVFLWQKQSWNLVCSRVRSYGGMNPFISSEIKKLHVSSGCSLVISLKHGTTVPNSWRNMISV